MKAALILITLALPVQAQSLRPITATLNMADAQPGAENLAADNFFAQLESSDGQAMRLNLTIRPSQTEGAPGYELRPNDPGTEAIICGNGNYGTIRNISTVFLLDFDHPNNFHAPTTIYIGGRLQFPRHNIACDGSSTGETYAPLHLRGDFQVEAVEILTAIEYTLFPINP